MNFEITYNSYEIGGSSTSAFPVGGMSWEENGTRLELSLDFVLVGSTVANYSSAEDTMMAALSTPEAAFTVAHGATTLFSGDPSTKTAFGIETAVRRVRDDRLDTERTKRWQFVLTCNLPPKKSGDSNRVAYSVTVQRGTSKLRQVTIAGTWSAGSGVGARANVTAGFTTLATSVLSSLGGTYDLVAQGPEEEDHRAALCSFAGTYAEVNYDTGVSGLLAEQVQFIRQRGIDNSPTRTHVVCTYTASVDASSVSESGIPAKIESVRAVLLAKAMAIFSADVGYVESKQEQTDSTGSSVTCTYSFVLGANGFPYRRAASVQLSFSTSRQMSVFLSGTYQSDGSDTAVEKHDADIATWAAAVLDDIDDADNFDLISEAPLTYDDDNQEVQFARLYRERLATTADTGILAENFSFARTQTLVIDDSGPAAVRGVIQGTAFYNKATVAPANIASQYASSLRAKLITQAEAQWGSLVVEQEETYANPYTGSVTVLLRVLFTGVNDLLEYDAQTSFTVEERITFRDVWDGREGSVTAQTPGKAVFATVTVRRLEFGSGGVGSEFAEPDNTLGVLPGARWIRLSVPTHTTRRFTIGTDPGRTGSTVLVTETTSTTVWRRAIIAPVPGAGPMEAIKIPTEVGSVLV